MPGYLGYFFKNNLRSQLAKCHISRNLSPIVHHRNECAKAHCSSPAIKPPVQSLKDSLISDSDGKTWLMAENKGGLVLGCEEEERYQITHVK